MEFGPTSSIAKNPNIKKSTKTDERKSGPGVELKPLLSQKQVQPTIRIRSFSEDILSPNYVLDNVHSHNCTTTSRTDPNHDINKFQSVSAVGTVIINL